MGSSEANEAKRETMTTAQAAKRLKISVASVRRRLDAEVLEGFRSPGMVSEDSRGYRLRGHRKIFVDSVEAYERQLREAETKSAEQNS